MHRSAAAPRRRPVAPFTNHTPRAHEFQKTGSPRQCPAMFGPTGMVVPMMLPPATSSSNSAPPKVPASEKSSTGGSAASYASSQAEVKSQEDDSRQTSSELTVSEGDGKSPFVDKMMTQTNLLVLPPSNPSYQMAYFLKTTGPVKEPTVKSARSKRISSAMRMFKNSSSSRYPTKSLASAHMRLVK
jgi:hypothetical protein